MPMENMNSMRQKHFTQRRMFIQTVDFTLTYSAI